MVCYYSRFILIMRLRNTKFIIRLVNSFVVDATIGTGAGGTPDVLRTTRRRLVEWRRLCATLKTLWATNRDVGSVTAIISFFATIGWITFVPGSTTRLVDQTEIVATVFIATRTAYVGGVGIAGGGVRMADRTVVFEAGGLVATERVAVGWGRRRRTPGGNDEESNKGNNDNEGKHPKSQPSRRVKLLHCCDVDSFLLCVLFLPFFFVSFFLIHGLFLSL